MVPWAKRIAFWLLYCAIAFCAWLLFVNTTKKHEIWLGLAQAAVAATGAEIVRSQRLAVFRPRLRWVLECWREPWCIVEGCTSIFVALIKHLIHPRPSVLREVVFDPGGDDAASAARRALAITYTTIPPNFVVLGINRDRKVMLVHQVDETETPTMTRNLGAKS